MRVGRVWANSAVVGIKIADKTAPTVERNSFMMIGLKFRFDEPSIHFSALAMITDLGWGSLSAQECDWTRGRAEIRELTIPSSPGTPGEDRGGGPHFEDQTATKPSPGVPGEGNSLQRHDSDPETAPYDAWPENCPRPEIHMCRNRKKRQKKSDFANKFLFQFLSKVTR
jgi:hypothetical protein